MTINWKLELNERYIRLHDTNILFRLKRSVVMFNIRGYCQQMHS